MSEVPLLFPVVRGDRVGNSEHADQPRPLPARVPPGMAGNAVNRANSSSPRHRSTQGAADVDEQCEALSMPRQSHESMEEASASLQARRQAMGIGPCLEMVRGLPGFEEGSPEWLAAAMLLHRNEGLPECLMAGCTTAEGRGLLLRGEIARANATGFFTGV